MYVFCISLIVRITCSLLVSVLFYFWLSKHYLNLWSEAEEVWMAVIISTRQRWNSLSNVKIALLAVFGPEVNCILISEYFPVLYWYCLRINHAVMPIWERTVIFFFWLVPHIGEKVEYACSNSLKRKNNKPLGCIVCEILYYQTNESVLFQSSVFSTNRI